MLPKDKHVQVTSELLECDCECECLNLEPRQDYHGLDLNLPNNSGIKCCIEIPSRFMILCNVEFPLQGAFLIFQRNIIV